jgi:hypothetical protein
MIIGIVGFIGAGKDTVADYLTNYHGFRRESFANSLKDAVSHIFGWDRTLLEGRTKQSRDWREQVDPWWSERLQIPNFTPRWILQCWGTEVGRKSFHNDIWIASLENKLRNSTDDVIITDCRFPNEISSIKKNGGMVIRVVRGPEPEWYETAIRANAGDEGAKSLLDAYNIHASETSWVGTKFDYVLNNNTTIDELYAQVRKVISLELDLPAAM